MATRLFCTIAAALFLTGAVFAAEEGGGGARDPIVHGREARLRQC